MITIKNEFLTASINEVGAELRSLTCNGREYIWEGKPEVWSGACPIMFPICGGLKDDKYIFGSRRSRAGDSTSGCKDADVRFNLCESN